MIEAVDLAAAKYGKLTGDERKKFVKCRLPGQRVLLNLKTKPPIKEFRHL